MTGGDGMRYFQLASAAIVIALSMSSAAMAADCQALTGKTFDDALILETDDVTAPIIVTNIDPLGPHGIGVTTPFCRVRGLIKPAPDSEIDFEVWLPSSAAWNGKVEGVGNGGFAGAVLYADMNSALAAGYAVSSTNSGHWGSMADARWAVGHPEKIVDLGWRAIHATAVASKAIVATYYGKSPLHAYFKGCSTGGRQGLVEAQRFPKDYDGIVAGAPANYWAQSLASEVPIVQSLATMPERWISPAKLAVINKAVVDACHGADGVVDDPQGCHFDPAPLLCKGVPSDACLTSQEMTSLRRIYHGLDDASGKSVYPGYTPGAEMSWTLWLMGPSQSHGVGAIDYPFAVGFYRDLIKQNPSWDPANFDADKDLVQALEGATEKAVYAEDPDLSAFKAAGGKLIQYHGWNDAAIPPAASLKYYDAVAATMGGVDALQSFYRLFLAPGMAHCGFGLAPNAVGGAFGLPASTVDADHDLVSALAHWVEDGVAPTHIVATFYQANDPAKGVAAQRPWCPYPQIARFESQGDRRKAESYACAMSQP
jgi:hypothetical protein